MKYLLVLFCTLLFAKPAIAKQATKFSDITYTDKDMLIASAYMFKNKLPVIVSDGMMLIDITINNDTITFTNVLDDDMARWLRSESNPKLLLSEYACGENSRDFYNNGFDVTFAYYNKQKRFIDSVTYTKQDCDFYNIFFGESE